MQAQTILSSELLLAVRACKRFLTRVSANVCFELVRMVKRKRTQPAPKTKGALVDCTLSFAIGTSKHVRTDDVQVDEGVGMKL